jgi:hypothetical protein
MVPGQVNAAVDLNGLQASGSADALGELTLEATTACGSAATSS